MTKRGLVSVVTPVYNGEAHVSRLLDSVLAQTYPEVRMILSDDGFTDGTVGVAAAYAPRFKEKGYSLQIVQSPHKNASAAINAGLCRVTGEYLVWPDADDELYPDSIARRVGLLKEHPEYDVGQNFQMLLPSLLRHKCPTIPEQLYRAYVRPDSHSRQKRSEAEEKRRYRLFEELIDEIMEICSLADNRATVDRITCWRAGRQANLARRYRHIGRFFHYKLAAIWFRLKGLL